MAMHIEGMNKAYWIRFGQAKGLSAYNTAFPQITNMYQNMESPVKPTTVGFNHRNNTNSFDQGLLSQQQLFLH